METGKIEKECPNEDFPMNCKVVPRESLKDIADRANMWKLERHEKLCSSLREKLRRYIQDELLNSAEKGLYELEITKSDICYKILTYPNFDKFDRLFHQMEKDVGNEVANANGATFKWRTTFSNGDFCYSLFFSWYDEDRDTKQ